MVSEEDIAVVVEACREVPDPVGDYLEDDFLVNLVATVVDFQTHTTAVARALLHFRHRVRSALGSVDDLVELMERWPATKDGNTALAEYLWGYKMWTRAQMLRDLVAYFISLGVTDQEQLRVWAQKASFADFEGQVRGLGPAVFQWLVMRQGVDTVKPDVHVHRFVGSVLGRQLSDSDAVAVLTEAARRLRRPGTRLDWAIWEAGRLGSVRPSSPAARLGADRAVSRPARSSRAQADGTAVASFIEDDAGYLAWLEAHPDGFVLNCEKRPMARYVVVHRASCRSINPTLATVPTGKSWTFAYRKVCAGDLDTLIRWSIAAAGPPSPCGPCKPAGGL